MSKEIFLTSSPVEPDGMALNPKNRFADRFRTSCAKRSRALFITSAPDQIAFTEKFAGSMFELLKQSGMAMQSAAILDGRNADRTEQLLGDCDLVILAGGHVPTQNAFFREISLRERMTSFDGTVLGISAGTMNSADIVYAQPEEAGEGIDPAYQKFLTGLNLTKCRILPHYQQTKDMVLDGKRLFEEITYPDSIGQTFYALPDGSYLYSTGAKEVLCGEVYQIRDGICRKICSEDEEVIL
jgi:dipeptidase E